MTHSAPITCDCGAPHGATHLRFNIWQTARAVRPYVKWQSRPVFVTSTFRDMHAERDHLHNFVFPELEKRLRERFHYLDPIDLRLGVETAEAEDPAARELLILKVCLDEIVRSRPFLIGLIGDRYGWVPPADRMHAAAHAAGYERDLSGRSVTALEIEFGVLGHPSQRGRSRFYLRDPLPYDQMPPNTAADFSEARSPEPGAAERAERLRQLKVLLRDELPAERVRTYTARWDTSAERVAGLEAWGFQVVEDLWTDLEAETRASAVATATTWQEQEGRLLQEFAAIACREFVGRDDLLCSLADLATCSDREGGLEGVCVVGPPGSGKSALFAELYRRLRATDVLLLAHAAGIGPRASDIDAVLRRWCLELAEGLGIPDPSADITARQLLKETFSALLVRAAAGRRVVCLVDALNQFERTPDGKYATWLPERWPRNARLIATAVPGTEAEALGRRSGIETAALPMLTESEAERIARVVASRRRAAIQTDLLSVLFAKRHGAETAAGNPLWLELALEEILLLDADDFARANQSLPGSPEEQLHALRLAVANALPADVEELYGFLLQHAEEVHGEALAREFANLIAASRSGWRESDLQRLLPMRTGEPWTDLRFAALRRGFRAHLVQRGAQGQWDFAHEQMRQAVLRRNLTDSAAAERLHTTIADPLESLAPDDPMRESELMYHLLQSSDRGRAARHYASDLREGALSSATLSLAAQIVEDDGSVLAASLLAAEGLPVREFALLCTRFLFQVNDALENRTSLLVVRLGLLLVVRTDLTRLAAAEPGNAGWQLLLSVSHDRIGDVLVAQGNLPGALAAYQASLATRARLAAADTGNAGWQRDLSVSHDNIGDVLVAQGNLPGALVAFGQSHAIFARLAAADAGNAGWQRDLSVSHNKIGDVLVAQGNLPGALAAYQASLATRARLAAADAGNAGWQRDLSVSHNKIGDVLVAQGNLPGALVAYQESLTITERLAAADPGNAEWQRDLVVSQLKLGKLEGQRGDEDRAIWHWGRCLAILRRMVGGGMHLDPGAANLLAELEQMGIEPAPDA